MSAAPFWRSKTLEEMTPEEWESLCDGCGRCCLNKLEDEETEELFFTSVACRLLDCGTCRCSDYANRFASVPDCVKLTPEDVRVIDWLPPTCAYRLVAEGRDLYWWHHLVSGDSETVHLAGVSVRGRVTAQEGVPPFEEYEDHIAEWPAEIPESAVGPART